MDLNEVEKWLQGGDGDDEAMKLEQWEEALACKFFDAFTAKGIHVDLVQRGRLVCSMKVPPRLINDEIEIEAKVLRMGKRVGVAMVELREKKTGKLIAQGRHAKYLAVSSKL